MHSRGLFYWGIPSFVDPFPPLENPQITGSKKVLLFLGNKFCQWTGNTSFERRMGSDRPRQEKWNQAVPGCTWFLFPIGQFWMLPLLCGECCSKFPFSATVVMLKDLHLLGLMKRSHNTTPSCTSVVPPRNGVNTGVVKKLCASPTWPRFPSILELVQKQYVVYRGYHTVKRLKRDNRE